MELKVEIKRNREVLDLRSYGNLGVFGFIVGEKFEIFTSDVEFSRLSFASIKISPNCEVIVKRYGEVF